MFPKTYSGHITSLGVSDVFVFTSNLSGFHGAGSAGWASFNEPGNVWRKFNYDKLPDGWKGKWNIKGVGWGYQEGTEGKSYAIPTVITAGNRRSFPLSKIKEHVRTFYNFASGMKLLNFFVAQEDKVGYSGYSPQEMGSVWDSFKIPDNVCFSDTFVRFLQTL